MFFKAGQTETKDLYILVLFNVGEDNYCDGSSACGMFVKAGQTETKDLQIIVLIHVGEYIAKEVAFVGCLSRLVKQKQKTYRL